ncbi:MAG: class I SAM-dependent methyltransferase [Proteobacteria bacterium]|nr:class I SAM-dependent methyltransferase [Pseudomonadota bacterium]MBU1389668.1 class I SAM-dependent methyltransferase [Pseudomonadota bacterium]MBU1542606.1 class I SAM-dependent methyltransferase [Pseudomonadota bacterium]MBU2481581.1 class I SAM-dependent methyltransferase [Pseudomonadota bacterium]
MKKTNWTKYYDKPYKTASFTRRITGRELVGAIKKHFGSTQGMSLTEIGGANSAFLELLLQELKPSEYAIIDSNATGLEKTRERIQPQDNVQLLQKDILTGAFDRQTSDLVLSVGLIEHFDQKGTQKAIQAHFEILKPGGYAVITFPTPTFLYRISRFISQKLGLWIFHDERPLMITEVLETAQNYGRLLEYKIIWPIFFTQGLAVFKKNI